MDLTKAITLSWLVFALLATPALAEKPAADIADWSGQWDTHWRGGGARLELQQEDAQVSGGYQPYDGLIEARAKGKLLIGRWIEKQNSGDFVFTMSPDGQTFMGRFASGEWWNGGRVSGDEEGSAFLNPDLSTPRAALKSFLIAFNQVRGGHIDFTVPAIAAVDFGSGAEDLTDGQRITIATALFDVIDQATLQVWGVPAKADGDATEIELQQAGTDETFLLEFKRNAQGLWRLAAQPVEVLDVKLKAFLAARGQERLRPNTHLELRSPRAALRTFVENVHRPEASAQEHVARTMDLSNIGESVRATEVPLLADYLRQVLNRISFLIWQEIPDDPTSPLPYIYFEHPAGNIVISPQPDGEETVWKFTSGTLETLRELFNAIEAMPVVEGVAVPRERLLFFRVRDAIAGLSPLMTKRMVLLENWQWLGMLLTFVVSVVVAFGLTLLVVRFIRWRFRKKDVALERKLELRFLWPIRLTFMAAIWYWSTFALGIPQHILIIFQKFALIVLITGGVWTAYNLTDIIGSFFHRQTQQTATYLDDIFVSLLTSLAKIVFVIAAALLLAEVLTIPYRTVIAGLGIGGLALAIGARETIANFFGSAVLLTDRPFRRGDLVTVNQETGFIERVGLRSTQIRKLDDSIMVIPNNTLANEIIDNKGKRRMRQVQTRIAVPFTTSPDKLDAFTEGMRQVVLDHPKGVSDKLYVGVWQFSEFAIELELFCYLDAKTLGEEREARHELFVEIVKLAERLDVEFAFPARKLYMDDPQAHAAEHAARLRSNL